MRMSPQISAVGSLLERPLVLRPSPALLTSRVIIWSARCASAMASVRWFSLERMFRDIASMRPATTMMTSVMPSATINSMSEKPAAPFALLHCFCIVMTPSGPRSAPHLIFGAVTAQRHAAARPAPGEGGRHGHGDYLLVRVQDCGVVRNGRRDVEGALVVVGRGRAADGLLGGHGSRRRRKIGVGRGAQNLKPLLREGQRARAVARARVVADGEDEERDRAEPDDHRDAERDDRLDDGESALALLSAPRGMVVFRLQVFHSSSALSWRRSRRCPAPRRSSS